jgi:glutathione S-transferase
MPDPRQRVQPRRALTDPAALAMLAAMTKTPTLWGLSVSPWTEKARWALDHHGLAYRYREHTPMLGEPALRWRTRGRPAGTRATVPFLIDGRETITDSNAIARHAEASGRGEPLFPTEHADAIVEWERSMETAMQAGRVLVTQALLANHDAQIEMLPPQIPGPLRRPLRPIARSGAAFFARKYDVDPNGRAVSLRTVTEFAERVRRQLDGHDHLAGDRFSWADVCAVMIVSGFAGGVPGRLTKLPASAQTWTQTELVEQFADLVAWRDRLYSKHRPSSARVR